MVDEKTDNNAVEITSLFSYSSLRISLQREQEDGEPVQRVCTGFLWQRGDTLYLITNWHCVTGWHPIEGRSLDNTGFEPELAVVSIAIADTSGKEAERLPDAKVSVVLRDGDRPTWLKHPKFGRHVDVVAIGLDFRDKVEGGRLLGKPINAYDYKDLDFQVGDEAFVIGYPMQTNPPYPIWKRASIATEPNLDMDQLPKILIDTATRSGMSGSPVLVIHRGLHRERSAPDRWSVGTAKAFAGVYSSRVGDSTGLQLGTVWKASVIDEIIDGEIIGRGPHDHST